MCIDGVTRFLLLYIGVFFTVPRVCGQPGTQLPIRRPSNDYPFVATLDPDFILRWNHNDTHISLEMQARTTGYLAIGFSEAGYMEPADIMMGYISHDPVRGRLANLADYHTTRYYPTLDQRQDLHLDRGVEANGWTLIGFTRLLDTCDTVGDRVITRDTQHIIYALNNNKPIDHLTFTKHSKKGSKTINLLTAVPPPYGLTTDVSIAELLNNYTIPQQDLNHHCRLFIMGGDVFGTTKYQIVKVGPIFAPETAHLVKKITLFRCRFTDMATLNQIAPGFDCFRDNAALNCKEYIAGFANGADDLYIPEDIGIPMGGPNSPNLYVLATVYENFNLESLLDQSGIRIWFTPNLRQNDGAYLTIASPISDDWYQFIPQGAPEWTQTAYCSPECLSWTAGRPTVENRDERIEFLSNICSKANSKDSDDSYRSSFIWGFGGSTTNRITVVGARFEAQGQASSMRLRHMSSSGGNTQGMTESPWLLSNRNYKDNAQTLDLGKARQAVNSGDVLRLDCSYNTSTQTTPVLGGWADQTELCRAHVMYYPPIQLEGCFSWVLYNTLMDGSGSPVANNRLFDVLKAENWSNPRLRDILSQVQNTSMHNAQCWSSQKTPSFHAHSFAQPVVSRPYQEPSTSNCPTFAGR